MGALRRQAGQSLAEFAVILLVLMLIVFGIVDLSRAVYIQSVVANAAREGARYGIVHPGDMGGIRAAVLNLAAGVDPSQLTIGLSAPDSRHVRVQVSYPFRPVTPLIGQFMPGGITLSSSSVMRRE